MTSPRLQEATDQALAGCPRHIEVDLDQVTFCDCSALNVLLGARASFLESQASTHLGTAPFTVVRAHPPVTRLFDLPEARRGRVMRHQTIIHAGPTRAALENVELAG